VNIAYLVNRYPGASHSFIRREIAAVEAAGGNVVRFSVRTADVDNLPDSRDVAEFAKTIVLLSHNRFKMILAFLVMAIAMPVRCWRAWRIALNHSSLRPNELVRRFAYLAEAVLLVRLMKQHSVSHLHAHFGTNPAMVARLAHILGGPPYSFTVHGPDEFDQPLQLDLKGKVADAAFCVAISHFGRGQLMRWSAPEHWRKIHVVRCGVDETFVGDMPAASVPGAPILCSVARLSAQKGIPLLIEAAAEVRRQGLQFKLVLVGDGELRGGIEQMIAQHGLGDIVSITGWASSEQVVQHIRSARAMVLPSFAEGLPVVIMEALALRRPVIVSAIAGTPELVDQQCGWLISSGSVDALVTAMKAALTASPAQLDEMGDVGRTRVITGHDSIRNGAALYQLIRAFHGAGDDHG
jgi:colanic acid/amylovoran biosynthesis glycosyltransferase